MRITMLNVAFVLLSVLIACVAFNPCDEPVGLKQGDYLNVGIVYWPGAVIEDWKRESAKLHPCALGDEMEVAEISVYRIGLNQVSLLYIGENDFLKYLVDKIPANSSEVITAAIFSGSTIISDARIIYVGNIGKAVVYSLAAIARFDRGDLKSIDWHNLGCATCGTSASRNCFDDQYCVEYGCTENSTANSRCRPTIHVALSGDDADSEVFNSGVQLQKIDDYSIFNLYEQGAQTVGNIAEGAQNIVEMATGQN